jgi:hypothetical protein
VAEVLTEEEASRTLREVEGKWLWSLKGRERLGGNAGERKGEE